MDVNYDNNIIMRKFNDKELVYKSKIMGAVLIVESNNTSLKVLFDYITKNKIQLKSVLNKCGGILFRGFDVNTSDIFETNMKSFDIQLTNEYRPGIAPRTKKGDYSFSSTEAPPALPRLPHNAMTYSFLSPEYI